MASPRSAFDVAMRVMVVLGLVLVAVAGHHAVRFLRSDEGESLLWQTRLSMYSYGGPGSPELRELGCRLPAIAPLGEVIRANATLYDDAFVSALLASPSAEYPTVMCNNESDPPPECDAIAATYAAAIRADTPIVVFAYYYETVMCEGIFSPTGTHLSPFDEDYLTAR